MSDLHYGVSMNDNNLQNVVNRISAEQADIVVLDGDIVDENTTSEQMQSAFRILGQADSTYGVYYVYGNHDKNNYAAKPNYSAEEMVGKKVMVLVNLKPAKLAGVLSEGMLLCAEDENGELSLMVPEKKMPAGAEIC